MGIMLSFLHAGPVSSHFGVNVVGPSIGQAVSWSAQERKSQSIQPYLYGIIGRMVVVVGETVAMIPVPSPQPDQQSAVSEAIAIPGLIDVDITDQVVEAVIVVIGIVNPVHIAFQVGGLIGIPVVTVGVTEVQLKVNKGFKRLIA